MRERRPLRLCVWTDGVYLLRVHHGAVPLRLDHYTGWLWLLMWGSLALEGIYLFDGCDFLGSAALSPPEPALCPGDEERTPSSSSTVTHWLPGCAEGGLGGR